MVSNPFGDGLSVRITGDSSSLERAVDSSQRALSGLSRATVSTGSALTSLAERTNNVGDELRRTSRQASNTSRSFIGLTASTEGVALSFGTLSTVLTASLIPAIGLLSTTLVPLAATLGTVAAAAGGLAAAFGAVVGSGLIAFGEQRGEQNEERLDQIQEQIAQSETRVEQIEAQIDSLEELRETNDGLTEAQRQQLQSLIAEREETERAIDKKEDLADKVEETTGVMGGLKDIFADVRAEITPLIVEFGQRFIPLVEDAINALPTLVENTIDAVGELTAFKDALRDFGQIALEAIPAATSALFELAEQALPVLNDVVQFFLENGQDIFESAIATVEALSDEFLALTDVLIELVPILNDVGTRVLSDVIDGLVVAAEAIITLNDAVEEALPQLRDMADTASTMLAPGIQTVTESLDDLALALSGATRSTQNAIPPNRTLARIFNNGLAPAIAGVVDNVTALVRGFQRLEPRTKQLAGAVLGVIGAVRTIAPLIAGLLTPINLLAGAVVGLTIAWSENFLGVRDVANEVATNLRPRLQELQTTLKSNVIPALKNGRGELEAWGPAAQNVSTGVADFVTGTLAPAFTGTVNTVVIPIVEELGTALDDDLRKTVDELGETLTSLNGTFNTVWQSIDSVALPLIKGVRDAFIDLVDNGAEALLAAMRSIMDLLQGDFQGAIEELELALESAFNALGQPIGEFADGLSTAVENAVREGVKAGLDVLPDDLSIDTPETGPVIPGGPFIDEDGGIGPVSPDNPIFQDQSTTTQTQSMLPSVEVFVEGDTGVIRDVSTQVVEERERRAKRQTGGSTQI